MAYTYGTLVAGPPVLFPGITLTWQRTAWRPRYHIFKMNSLGNWVTVRTLATNGALVTLDLASTELGSNVLPKQNARSPLQSGDRKQRRAAEPRGKAIVI